MPSLSMPSISSPTISSPSITMPQMTKSGESPYFYHPQAKQEEKKTEKPAATTQSLEQALLQLKTNDTDIEQLLQLMDKNKDSSEKTENNDITLLKSLLKQGNFSASGGMSTQMLELLLKEIEKKTE